MWVTSNISTISNMISKKLTAEKILDRSQSFASMKYLKHSGYSRSLFVLQLSVLVLDWNCKELDRVRCSELEHLAFFKEIFSSIKN